MSERPCKALSQLAVVHSLRRIVGADEVGDLQEELRHLVDALVWTLVRRRQVKTEDFTESKKGGGVWMSHDTRKLFVESFEARLLTEFTPPGQERKVTYREFLFQQAVQLRHLVLGHIETYRPLRIAA